MSCLQAAQDAVLACATLVQAQHSLCCHTVLHCVSDFPFVKCNACRTLALRVSFAEMGFLCLQCFCVVPELCLYTFAVGRGADLPS